MPAPEIHQDICRIFLRGIQARSSKGGGEMEVLNISVNIAVEKPIEADHDCKYWYHISKRFFKTSLQMRCRS